MMGYIPRQQFDSQILLEATRKNIPLLPMFGLCNRLRFVFSKLEENPDRKLNVLWQRNPDCNGHFLDVFKEVPMIEFIDDWSGKLLQGFTPIPGYEPNYRELQPIDVIEEKVNKVVDRLENNFTAVHVRRTDFAKEVHRWGRFTSDNYFVEAIAQIEGLVYLATDNPYTVRQFQQRFGDRIIAPDLSVFNINNLRQTSLAQAVEDMFISIRSTRFIGTPFSSFSELIESIRNQNK